MNVRVYMCVCVCVCVRACACACACAYACALIVCVEQHNSHYSSKCSIFPPYFCISMSPGLDAKKIKTDVL